MLGLDPGRDGPGIRGRLGVVPQHDTLDNELTVRENLIIYGALLRHLAAGGARARGEAARVRAARRAGERQGRAAVGRDEAPAHDRALARQRPRADAPRRADHRARPAGAPRRVGPPVPAQAAGRDARADDALHGRGRAAVRPARDHGPRADRGGGLAARADPAALDARGGRAALRGDVPAVEPEAFDGRVARGSRCYRTGSCSTPTTATRSCRSRTSGCRPSSVLVRRSTLEDVFLRLTGRTLVD